jgi:hypothetical protein
MNVCCVKELVEINNFLGQIFMLNIFYLSSDHDGARDEWRIRILLNSIVHCDDVQAVEQLPLVFVNALDLDVKNGRRVDVDTVVLLQNFGQLHFVLLLGFLNGALEASVLGPLLQLLEVLQVHGPGFSNFLQFKYKHLYLYLFFEAFQG